MTQSPISINFRDVVRRWISDDNRRLVAIAAVTALHLTAAVILLATEVRWLPWIVFLLSWMFWNCLWLVLLPPSRIQRGHLGLPVRADPVVAVQARNPTEL